MGGHSQDGWTFNLREAFSNNEDTSPSNYDPNNYVGSQARDAFHEHHQHLAAARLEGAWRPPIDMKPSEIQRLNESIAPMIAYPSDDAIARQNYSMHPIPFVQTYICQALLDRFTRTEIGGNTLRTAAEGDAHLSCMALENDGREDYRVLKAMLSTRDFNARMNNYLHNGCCFKGAQHCTIKTEKLTCNNVLYWLDMQKLFDLFETKCVKMLNAAMVFPKGLSEGIDTQDQLNGVHFSVSGSSALMSFFDDQSLPYVQDLATWQEYQKATVKDGHRYGKHFNLIFEHVKKVGIMTIVSIARTQRSAHLFQVAPSDPSIVSITNWIPLMADLVEKSKCSWFRDTLAGYNKLARAFSQLPKFKIPRSILAEVDGFLYNRRDEQIDRQNAGAILVSKMQRIVVGQYTIQRGSNALVGDFADLCIILLLRSYIVRQRATKTVAFASLNIMKEPTEKHGLFRSLYELLFTHSLDSNSARAQKKRFERFAVNVMHSTPRFELLRQLIIDYERPVCRVYEQWARGHNITIATVPHNREYVYDPPQDGYCYKSAIAKCGGYTNLGKEPTRAEIDADLQQRGYEQLPIEINGGHAIVKTVTENFCQHGMAKDLYLDDLPSRKCNLTNLSERRWLRDVGSDNHHKSELAVQLLGKQGALGIANICAMPANDELLWSRRMDFQDLHCLDTRYFQNRVLPHYSERHTFTFNVNVLCHECMSSLPTKPVFADLGTSLDTRFLSAFYSSALANIRSHCHSKRYRLNAVVKVQNFTAIMESGKSLLFQNELKHWEVHRAEVLQANEVYLTNVKGTANWFPPPSGEPMLTFKHNKKKSRAPAAPILLSSTDESSTESSSETSSSSESGASVHFAPARMTGGLYTLVEEESADEPTLAAIAASVAPSAPPAAQQEPEEPTVLESDTTDNESSTGVPRAPNVPLPVSRPIASSSSESESSAGKQKKQPRGQRKAKRTEAAASVLPAARSLYEYAAAAQMGKRLQKPSKEIVRHNTTMYEEFHDFTEQLHDAEIIALNKETKLGKHNRGMFGAPLLRENPSPNDICWAPIHGQVRSPRDSKYFLRSQLLELTAWYGSAVRDAKLVQVFDYDHSEVPYPFDGKVLDVKSNTIIGPLYQEPKVEFQSADVSFVAIKDSRHSFAKELAAERQDVYKELHGKIAAELQKWKPKKNQFTFKLMEGTYGCGKSYHMKELIKQKHTTGTRDPDYIVICPTSTLAREYQDDGFNAKSWSKGIQAITSKYYVTVYIDEYFLFDPRVLHFIFDTSDDVYAVGDRRQLSANVPLLGRYTLVEATTAVQRLNITRSAPNDVVAWLNRTEPEATVTRSRVVTSIEPKFIRDMKEVGACKIDCSQNHDHQYCYVFDRQHSSQLKMRTVATIQGLREKETHLLLTPNSKPLISQIPSQVVVSMSRHLAKLVIYHTSNTSLLIRKFGVDRDGKPIDPNQTVGARDRHFTEYGHSEVLETVYVQATIDKFKVYRQDAVAAAKQVKHYNQRVITKAVKREARRVAENKLIESPVVSGADETAEEREVDAPPQSSLNTLADVELSHTAIVMKGEERLSRVNTVLEQLSGKLTAVTPVTYDVNAEHAERPIVRVALCRDAMPDEACIYDKGEVIMPNPDKSDSVALCSVPQYDPMSASAAVCKAAPTSSKVAQSYRSLSVQKTRGLRPGKKMILHTHEALTYDESKLTCLQMAQLFAIEQNNSPNHRLATTVGRYGVVKRHKLSRREAVIMADELILGFQKFVATENLRAPHVEEYEVCRAQAIIRAAAKKVQTETDVWGATWATSERIKCFNKVQLKCKVGEEKWLDLKDDGTGLIYVKAGQMVSAQPKEVNQVVAPHVNWAERIVVDSLKPGVYLGYGHQPAVLSKKMQRHWRHGEAAQVLSLDISEQDTTKNEATDIFMRWVYRQCGVPEKVIDAMEKPNKHWSMDNRTASIKVKNQFQSGRADTLTANTFHIMAEAGRAYELDELQLALFQGDDCYLRAGKIQRINQDFENLKEDYSQPGEFVGFIVHDGELHLDIVRSAAKLLSRDIGDDQRYEQLAVATRDALASHKNLHQQRLSCVLASVKHKITYGDALQVYDYLVSFARGRGELNLSEMKRKGGQMTREVKIPLRFM